MMSSKEVETAGKCKVHNIGGISESTVTLPPGVTVLSGRNATNRTSFLRSIMGAMGSDKVSLKGDADEGSVELTIDGDQHSRTLTRRNGQIVRQGNPYLAEDEVELAELFAFLLESNEARQAVMQERDLRDIIMRPIDTDAVEAKIAELDARRQDLEDELGELDNLERRLHSLEQQRTEIERQIQDKKDELAAKEEEIEVADSDVDEPEEERNTLEEKLGELRDVRGELEQNRADLEAERESIDALHEERTEIEAALDELPDPEAERITDIQNEITRLREEKQAVETTINELQSVIQFNEDRIEDRSDFVYELTDGESQTAGSVTDKLLDETDPVVCWTCGTEVDYQQIDQTLDLLREFRNEKVDTRNTISEDIDALQADRDTLEAQLDELKQRRRRLDQIDDEIDTRTDRIDDLESERERLRSAVDTLEQEVEALRAEDFDDILDLHREANQLEFELEQLENELAELDEEIAEIEERLDDREQIEAQREEIQAEIEKQRTFIERIERDAVEEFNEHMEAILDLLEYQNIEKIWIERTEKEVRDGQRKVTKGAFDLHVVRSTESGSVYEDTIHHLSESEREVTGLIFALAGYRAHSVHETVPFMLLDSLEALDPARVAALIDYFEEYTDRLVVALLPEAADALADDYHLITEI